MIEAPEFGKIQTVDVRNSGMAIFPVEALRDYHYISDLAQELGCKSLELVPTLGMLWCLNQLADEKEIPIGSVHSHPNFGYKNLWSLLKEDPLRPGERLSAYNLAMMPHGRAKRFIRELKEAIPELGVVVYPHMGYELRTDNDWMQTHPAVFGDTHNADDLINLVEQKAFAGVVWDTAHAIEPAIAGGQPVYPLGANTADSLASLKKLLEAGVVREVHLQAGRTAEGYEGEMGLEQLRKVVDNLGKDYLTNTELWKVVDLVLKHDRSIPLVVEISPSSIKALGYRGGDIRRVQKDLVSWLKSM